MSIFEPSIARALQAVQARIQAACAKVGRAPGSVRLLAVSKTMPAAAVQQAFAAGQTDFGENYIQEALAKQQALRGLPLQWHCIGPVQSNKTRQVAAHFDWLHTLERLKIAERLNAQRPAHLPPLQVCIQVNVDGGATKSGLAPADLPVLVRALLPLPRLSLRGLMTIPEPQTDFAAQLRVHQQARALFDQVQALALPGLTQWDTLSIGMSNDLEAAVEAGSTLVRVGTAIFGAR